MAASSLVPVYVALGVGVLSLLWLYLERVVLKPLRIIRRLRAQGIPGYPFVPVLGQLPDFFRREARRSRDPQLAASTKATQFAFDGFQEYGPLWYNCLGPAVQVACKDPVMVRQVFITQADNFVKPEMAKMIKLLGNGLVTSEGELWARQRRLINPAFHMKEIQRLYAAMARCAAEAVRDWEGVVAARPGQPLDMDKELSKLTLTIITATAFGMDLAGSERGDALLKEVQENFTLYFESTNITRYLAKVFPPYALMPTDLNKKMWRSERVLRGAMGGIISARIALLRKNGAYDSAANGHTQGQSTDLLQLMLTTTEAQDSPANGGPASGATSRPHGTSAGAGSGPLMSEQQLMDECLTFLTAGHETTAVLLTWTMLLLSKHREWQERAREEVLQVASGPEWVPTHEEANQLKHCHCILLEVLRLLPPVPGNMRTCVRDTVLSDTLTIPAGCDFFVAVESMHQDEEYWGPDAKEFNPARFAEGVTKAASHPGAFMPFGGGPRVCIGQNFALIEGKLILALLLSRFEWALSDSYKHHPVTTITMRPKNGLPVVMEPLRFPKRTN